MIDYGTLRNYKQLDQYQEEMFMVQNYIDIYFIMDNGLQVKN